MPPKQHLHLTDRDRVLLEALAEHRLGVAAQAAHWLGVTERTAIRRIERLADDDLGGGKLIHHEQLFKQGSPMIRITAAGLKRIGSPLGAPGQKLDEYRHDVGVGWVWTAAKEGAFGEMADVITERHLRSHDARLEHLSAGARLAEPDGLFHGVGVGRFNGAGRALRHYPDLLLRSRAGKTIAVELELSRKSAQRLDRVMTSYATDSRIDAVLYLVPDAAMADRIRRAAARAGIEREVYVRQLAPGGVAGVDPPPDRTAEVAGLDPTLSPAPPVRGTHTGHNRARKRAAIESPTVRLPPRQEAERERER